jgi:hypothetical protein
MVGNVYTFGLVSACVRYLREGCRGNIWLLGFSHLVTSVKLKMERINFRAKFIFFCFEPWLNVFLFLWFLCCYKRGKLVLSFWHKCYCIIEILLWGPRLFWIVLKKFPVKLLFWVNLKGKIMSFIIRIFSWARVVIFKFGEFWEFLISEECA